MKKLMITMMLFAATMLCGNVANAQCQKKADCKKECVKKADCKKDCQKACECKKECKGDKANCKKDCAKKADCKKAGKDSKKANNSQKKSAKK